MSKETMLEGLNEFWQNYIVTTVNGSFQVFRSFTYGEMMVALLLAGLIVLFCLKWIWEALR